MANNPDKVRLAQTARRFRINNSGGTIRKDEWNDLKAHYGNRCLCCGRNDVKITLDHVIPLYFGGKNTIDNAQPLCGSCNSIKQIESIDFRPDSPNYNSEEIALWKSRKIPRYSNPVLT